MKKIDTSNIITGVGMPIKSGVVDFINESIQDTTLLALKTLTGLGMSYTNPANTIPLILSNVFDFSAVGVFTCTNGILLYKGELFYLHDTTFNVSATPVVVLQTLYSNTGANADPITFTDSNAYNVLQTRRLAVVDGSSATSGYICDFSSLITLPYEQGVYYDQNSTTVSIPIITSNTILSTIPVYTKNSKSKISGFVTCALSAGAPFLVFVGVYVNGVLASIGEFQHYLHVPSVSSVPFDFILPLSRMDVVTLEIRATNTGANIINYSMNIIQQTTTY